MEHPTKMTRGEPKGLSQAMVGDCWMEMDESRELASRHKWTRVQSGQDGFVGVVDGFSMVGIGGFPSQIKKFRLTKVACDWAVAYDIWLERSHNIGMNPPR
jgi:hypothetical protein